MPMCHQLYYYNQVVDYSDWREFTEIYCLISTMLFDTNSPSLTRVGFDSWESILTPIQLCSNLKILALYHCSTLKSDMKKWYKAILSLQSLVELRIVSFNFEDSEMWILCHSLTKHPAIRYLEVSECRLTSLSCEPLALLIPTLPQLRELIIFQREPSSPEPDKLEMLRETAEYFSVKIS